MGEADNVRAVERLVAGLNVRDVEVMNEVFVDDSILSWPQSGEINRGCENHQGVCRAFSSPPTNRPYRTVSCEPACWAKLFPAPEWRAKWVDRA